MPKMFRAIRMEDVSHISGIGCVFYGIEFDDGVVYIQWCVKGKPRSFEQHTSMKALEEIHGHEGKTKIEWL